MFNSARRRQLCNIAAAGCLCLTLSGCPSVSNPTQPEQSQTPPPSTIPPPQSSSSSSAGSTSNQASNSSPSQAAQSSPGAERESTEQSGSGQTSSATSNDAMGPPDDETQTSGASGEQGESSGSEANSNRGDSMEPGFGDGIASSDNLPDLRDEPVRPTTQGTTSKSDGTAADVGASENAGQSNGETAGSGSPDGYDGSSRYSIPTGMLGDSGSYDSPTGMPAGGSGPLTPAEQVAILDAQLEKGAGEFDTIIMQSQQEQRAAARAKAAKQPPTPIGSANSADVGQGNGSYENGTADAGGYSTGGGMGGTAVGGRVPQNTAKYPPPADIPSANNDDVVARQLREAAMREPDPAVRERLWDEYRKYTGLEK